jgi:uncharacterized repeat protein (TIGR03943 family)
VTARTQAVILIMFGAALVRLSCGDALLNYVRPSARPPVLCAGGVVALLGMLPLCRAVSSRRPSRAAWLVLLPVVAVAVVAPPPLGVLTAARPPSRPPRPGHAFAPLPAGNPVHVALIDVVLRAVWDHGRTLRGHELQVVGFVARTSGAGFVLTRLVITCCAADAVPYDIEIRTNGAAPPPGQWVAVTGTYDGMSPADDVVPALCASAITPIARPANPYG